MKLRSLVIAGLLLSSVVAITGAVPASAVPQDAPMTLVMNAQSVGNTISGQTRMTVTINRWSSQEDRNTVLGALMELGPGAVRTELQKLPEAGRIRIGTENSYPLQYARLQPLEDGGYRLLVATDRDIDVWEAYYRRRSLDYNIALAEFRLDANFNGEGVLAAGVEFGWHADTNTVVIEEYEQQPVRLRNVRLQE